MSKTPAGNGLTSWRNKLVSSRRFRSIIQNTPLLRRFAQHQANKLFSQVTGFVHTQVLLACVELEILEQIADSPLTAEELACRCDIPTERMQVLLRAAESLSLVQKNQSDEFTQGQLGAVLESDPGIKAMISHHQALYRDLADPVALLRDPQKQTELSHYWAYASRENAEDSATSEVAHYTGLMGSSQSMVSEQILRGWSPGNADSLLDVGGGDGHFIEAVAAQHPNLRLGLFDLPAVAQIADTRLSESSPNIQVSFHAGNFHQDKLPEGYSVISLVRILHDHDDADALALLKNVRQSLSQDGELLIAEPLRETRGAEAMGGAYFGFYLLAMGRGRPRSLKEMKKLLNLAGFSKIKRHRTSLPLVCTVISAQ